MKPSSVIRAVAYNLEYIGVQLYFTDCQQDVFILQRPKSLNFALNVCSVQRVVYRKRTRGLIWY